MSFFSVIFNGLRPPALPGGSNRMFAFVEQNHADIDLKAIPRDVPDRNPGRRTGAPIFIQAMWRASSTYIWKKFRDQPQYRAYCEPLHEILSRNREEVRQANGPDVWKYLRHPVNNEFYFAEFPFTADGGVEHFEKSLSFERYCLEETERDEPLRRYIAGLIDHAGSRGQTAVLQFNRGLLRAGWLSRQFRPIQILLLRRPLNLWKSFLSFPGHSFPTYISMIFGQNQEKSPLRRLPSWLDFPRFVRPTVKEEWELYRAFTAEHVERLYPSFFDLFVLGTLHCAQFSDCILDLDEISRNPGVRKAATERLREFGIAIDLEDCSAPSYQFEEADREWQAYEDFSRQFLRRALPEEFSISRERMDAQEPLLGPYFRELLAGFTGRRRQAPEGGAGEKSASAVQLFAGRQFESAAQLLGDALAEEPTSTRWNDWAVAQAACSRPHLAELGFGQSLRCEPADREAAGNLGALLLSQKRTREALPWLERAELETNEATRVVVSKLVNEVRRTLGFSDPDDGAMALDLVRTQHATLERMSANLAGLEQRLKELSEVVSRLSSTPAGESEAHAGDPRPRRPRRSAAKAQGRAYSEAASRSSRPAGPDRRRSK